MSTLYLLTGAAGFLGSHICENLLARGDRVRALVLPGDKSVKYVPAEVEIVEGNLCDMASLDKFFDVPAGTKTIAIHCASMVTTNPDFSQKLIDINVGGTNNMIDQCLKHPECEKMVYVSSTGAIPELPKGQAITEVDHFDSESDKVVGWYSKTKAMASQAVLDAVHDRGLNACIVHPSGILGPKDFAVGETTGTVIKIMTGKMPIGMGGSFNLCDVRDLADGCIAAADKGRKGECYILGNKEVTMKEMCRLLYEASGCKTPYFYVPLWMAWKLADQMEKKAKKTGEKPLMTNFAVYNLARNNTFDYSKAENELGYHTRPYAETLRDEAEWLVAEGFVPKDIKADEKARKAETKEKKLTSGRKFVEAVAGAKSKEKLRITLNQGGITALSEKNLADAYNAIALSQKWDELKGIFADKDYDSCSAKLAQYGVSTTKENFDLVNEVIASASDEALLSEIMPCTDLSSSLDVLAKHGYNAITADFLQAVNEEAATLREDTFLTDKDIAALAGESFEERCSKSINLIFALSAIIGLNNGLALSAEPAQLIAVAAGISLMFGMKKN